MKRPPGPSSLKLIRRLIATRGNLLTIMQELADRYGDVVRAKVGPSTFYLINHPDLIEEVLVTHEDRFVRVEGERRVSGRLVDRGLFTTEGEDHLRRRDVMESVMYRSAAPASTRNVVDLALALAKDNEDGETVELFGWMESFTTAVIMQVLFGKGPQEQRGRDLAKAITNTIAQMDAMPVPFTSLPERFPKLQRRFLKERARLDALILAEIQEHRADPTKDDVLSLLIAAGSIEGPHPLSDADLRDELVSLFRGHQAVSTALTWTFFQLASLPEIEVQVQAEADSYDPMSLRFEDMATLDMCRRVFEESLRLYPPAYVLARTSIQDHMAGGYVIPKGSRILVSEWVAHRDTRFWTDPTRFDPDRFYGSNASSRPEFSYFPQGGGKKMCMGRHFVRPMEGPILLASLARIWKMTLVPNKPVQLSAKATLKPKNGVWVTLHRR
ncbi:MAG: cytochrome P450 [Actinomycetota bacterium]|nr:cytochrome P450 [Actinomycetota bacterium]